MSLHYLYTILLHYTVPPVLFGECRSFFADNQWLPLRVNVNMHVIPSAVEGSIFSRDAEGTRGPQSEERGLGFSGHRPLQGDQN